MFAECDKHYPSRSGQTSLATSITNRNNTKPVTKNDFGPSNSIGILWHYYDTAFLLYGKGQ